MGIPYIQSRSLPAGLVVFHSGAQTRQPPAWHFTGIRNAVAVVLYEHMRNIIAGVVLIGIGLAMGDSIFLGDFGILSLFFDGLGFFWIGKGILQLWRQRQPQQ